VQVFNVPLAIAAVFLFTSIRHLEREKVAASLCPFWLPLELNERIERLGLTVHIVLRLKSGGFDGGNANGTNIVLSRVARKQTNLSGCIMFSEGN